MAQMASLKASIEESDGTGVYVFVTRERVCGRGKKYVNEQVDTFDFSVAWRRTHTLIRRNWALQSLPFSSGFIIYRYVKHIVMQQK